MLKSCTVFLFFINLLVLIGCHNQPSDNHSRNASVVVNYAATGQDSLPALYATKSKTNFSKVIGWPAGKTPVAPDGFSVTKFADSLDHPRWIYIASNNDIFVAESNTVLSGLKKLGAKVSRKIKTQGYGESADRITLFRDNDGDGRYEVRSLFKEGLNQPLGMLVLGNYFYVANTDGLVRFNYSPGDTKITQRGTVVLSLPAGGYNNHWTRNIIASKKGDKIFVSVGSGSNVAEHGMENEVRRANILEINPDGSSERIYASGLRNPVGMAWAPGTQTLWTAVNERDELGDELVPDYITGVKDGGFYGWPYSYFGRQEDPRMKKKQRPDLVKKAIVPDLALGAHTASLGLAFDEENRLPGKYKGGAFIGQHGSWNRSQLAGYKVVFVPFEGGKPAGKTEDFLTGFIADASKSEVYGRPVGIALTEHGSLLVADDVSGIIWLVRPNK